MSFRLGDFKQQIDPALLKRTARRPDGRAATSCAALKLTTGYLKHAEGSCLIEAGRHARRCAPSASRRRCRRS